MLKEGEIAQSPELLIFGEHEQRPFPVDELVVLPQVRSGLNPDLRDIKESIRANGLLNPIDVARMDEFQLYEYVEFVNHLWGTSIDPGQYESLRGEDGFFYMVIAGHTRTEAISQLQAEDEHGRRFAVMTKVHKIADPAEIISLQLDENLHSKPAQERQAMAIVEAYEYGRLHEKWSSPAEFAKLNKGKFSRKILSEALGFARLPSEARDFVFSGSLSYNAAVELGKASENFIDSIAARFGLGADEAPTSDLVIDDMQEAYRLLLAGHIAHIQAHGLNSTASKKYIQGQAILATEKAAKLRGEMDESDSLFDMSFVSADEQRLQYLRELRGELWQAHQKIARVAHADNILKLHGELARLDMAEARETYRRSIGRLGLSFSS